MNVIKVVHIIPAAFNYFDDIKSFVFSIVDLQNHHGVEASAITLQYGSGDVKKDRDFLKQKKVKAKTKKDLPNYEFKGVKSIGEAVGEFDQFDIVHMHLPFFGAGKLILNWKKENPDIPFVITYYHDFVSTDFFSLVIKNYNKYYVSKLLNIADMVTCIDSDSFAKSLGFKVIKDKTKLFVLESEKFEKNKHLTNSKDEVELSGKKFRTEIAEAMLSTYMMLLDAPRK